MDTRYRVQVQMPDGTWSDTSFIFKSMTEGELFIIQGMEGIRARVVPC